MKPLSPLQAIHEFCKQCQGSRLTAILDACNDRKCPFWGYRLGKAISEGKHRPTKAVRAYCLNQCQAGEGGYQEVKQCQGNSPAHPGFEPCPLYRFRLGKNPNRKPRLTQDIRG